ncbi:MAG: selenide, water dikinase SelD [Micrococcales bacterium]|nr:selenide, water dikinase SelD [Micrococcales bacterium]
MTARGEAAERAPAVGKRLTQYAAGGGCACKIPAGRLEKIIAGLPGGLAGEHADLLVGIDDGDDAAAVRVRLEPGPEGRGEIAVISTADFFTPVVDDPYDWGRIAATNALSDVYAMGGRPVLAINLVAWPAAGLSDEVLREVLRGGADVGRAAGCPVAGGHSIIGPEPTYGMAVTGIADPKRLLRNDAARPGLPITLTKPIGTGILGNRHKSTGEVFDQAIETMTTLNAAASGAALAAGVKAATDVTGFGLLGHLWKMLRASGVGASLDVTAIPVLPRARESLADGHVPGGSRRNLDWVRAHLDTDLPENELILLADAQTSGGLLVIGEIPGSPVIGHTVPGPARIAIA